MKELQATDVAERIRLVLADHLRVDQEKIKPEALLREDLGLDSADTIELVFKMEETFNLQIPDDDLEKFKTVRDLTEYVEEWSRRSAPPTPEKQP